MRLTTAERTGATWQAIKTHLTDRLSSLRLKNDADLDEKKTHRLRGAIGELKALLALGEEAPTVPAEDEFKD